MQYDATYLTWGSVFLNIVAIAINRKIYCRDLYGFKTIRSIYTLLKHDFKQQDVMLLGVIQINTT